MKHRAPVKPLEALQSHKFIQPLLQCSACDNSGIKDIMAYSALQRHQYAIPSDMQCTIKHIRRYVSAATS